MLVNHKTGAANTNSGSTIASMSRVCALELHRMMTSVVAESGFSTANMRVAESIAIETIIGVFSEERLREAVKGIKNGLPAQTSR